MRRRHKRFLYRAGVCPTNKIERSACFIIGSRRTRASERLLSDNRPCRLVVDIKIARRITQNIERFLHCKSVASENRARQPVNRSLVAKFQSCLIFSIFVNKNSYYRTENFFPHCFELRIGSENNRWLNKIADRLISFASEDDFRVGRTFRIFDIRHNIVERSLVDNGVHEIAEVLGIAHFNFFQHIAHFFANLLPERAWNICTRTCRTFLSLIFECATHDSRRNFERWRRRMYKNKVFPTCFTHDFRI